MSSFFNIEEYKCVHCGQSSIKYTRDDTEHYNTAICLTCGTQYLEYSSHNIWADNDDRFFHEVELTK